MSNFFPLPPILIGAATATLVSPLAVALTPAEVSTMAIKITVLITGPELQASGIIIAKDGQDYSVLTVKSVAEKINSGRVAKIKAPDQQEYSLKPDSVEILPNVDLAIIKFVSNHKYEVAALGDSQLATAGTPVYVAGFIQPTQAINFPLFTFTTGEITAQAPLSSRNGYNLTYDNSTLEGMNGGPVLNENGEIIAVHGKTEQGITEETTIADVERIIPLNFGIFINTYRRWLGEEISLEKTMADYNEAIRLNPNFAKAYYHRGLLHYQNQEYQTAKEDFHRAIQLNNKYTLAYLHIAIRNDM